VLCDLARSREEIRRRFLSTDFTTYPEDHLLAFRACTLCLGASLAVSLRDPPDRIKESSFTQGCRLEESQTSVDLVARQPRLGHQTNEHLIYILDQRSQLPDVCPQSHGSGVYHGCCGNGPPRPAPEQKGCVSLRLALCFRLHAQDPGRFTMSDQQKPFLRG
jgi:hypothetical protein